MQLNDNTEISCDVSNFGIFLQNWKYQILASINETKYFFAQLR